MTNKIATSIIKRKKAARAAVHAALQRVEKVAIGPQDFGPGSGLTYQPGPTSAAKPELVSNNAPQLSAPPAPLPTNEEPTVWQQGVANSKRVSSGVLNSLAGGLGTLVTGIPYGLNEAWNGITPKSLNTSQTYSNILRDTFDDVVTHTNESAADVVGGLGLNAGPDTILHPAFKPDKTTAYSDNATDRIAARNRAMAEGADPNSWTAYAGRRGENFARTGEEAWNWAQALMSMRGAAGAGKILQVPRAATAVSAAASRSMSPQALNFANNARRTASYLTGLPLASNLDPRILFGSLAGQSVLGNAINTHATMNAESGIPTNPYLAAIPGMLPANAPYELAKPVVGPEAAEHAARLITAPAIGNPQLNLQSTLGYGAAFGGQPIISGLFDQSAPWRATSSASPAATLEPPPAQDVNLGAQYANDIYSVFSDPEAIEQRVAELPPDQQARAQAIFTQMDNLPEDSAEMAPLLSELKGILLPPVNAAPADDAAGIPSQSRRPFDLDPSETVTPTKQPRRPFSDDPTSTTAAPAAPLTTTDAPLPGIPADANPKDIEAAEAEAARLAELKKENPAIAAAVADPTSEEGQQIAATGQQKIEQQLSADYASRKPPPTNPQDFGQWLNGMTTYISEMWESLGPLGQIAFGLGVPIGLIGLMGDGVGSFLTAAVGLGAAGTALASAGAFGETAQQGTNSALGAVSSTAGNITGSNSGSSARLANSSAGAAANPELTGNADAQLLTQMANTWTLKSFAEQNKDALIKLLGKTDEELIDVLRGLDPTTQGYLNTQLKRIAEHNVDDPETAQDENDVVKPQVSRAMNLLARVMTQKNGSAYVRNTLMPKIARCWKGYEPVPGKKPYTDGSCRPAGSKKKQKQMKKKSASDTYALASSNKLLNTIRGYYVKQAYTQSTQIRPQSRPQAGA